MSSLQVTWKKMGPEFIYDVLYSRNSKGPWIRHNDFRLTDDSIKKLITEEEEEREYPAISAPYDSTENNVYYIDTLESDQVYYVKVKCYDKYKKWWYSYSAYDSIEGGLSEPHNRPNPTGGNSLGFQFQVV